MYPYAFNIADFEPIVKRTSAPPRTTEPAVMVDAFRPLPLGPAAAPSEDPDYAWTWVR